MKILDLGDSALSLLYDFSNDNSHQLVTSDYHSLKGLAPAGIKDIVLCFSSIGIYYNPAEIMTNEVRRFIKEALAVSTREAVKTTEPVTIPVYYGGRYGPDLPAMAETLGLTPNEVISEHAAAMYEVWSIGFLPGFPYLGKLSPRLVLPRKPTPAPKVPAGSVAVAGWQTGIYPVDSPGGWHVIGWTPAVMFDLKRDQPCLLQPGDTVRFIPVNFPADS